MHAYGRWPRQSKREGFRLDVHWANRENGENRTLRGQLHRLALPIGMGTDQQIAFRTDHGELMRKGVVTVD